MYQMDNEKFGQFIAQLRKEKHLTQKALAKQLFISDKAVSKWERGLSIPGVSMLIPMAEILGVTVTELLRGERLEAESSLNRDEIEKLVTCSMDMSLKAEEKQRRKRRWWLGIYILALCVTAAELVLFRALGLMWSDMADGPLLCTGLLLVFGGWFCVFAKETLPSFYDKNKIHFVSEGVFRMNIPGLYFNNSNWPYILNVGRGWTCGGAVLLPAVSFIGWYLSGSRWWENVRWIVPLVFVLGMFIPMYIFGKKYE